MRPRDASPDPVSGPCASLRVIDLSRSLAGALTTMLLADYGADVLMIEPRAGHPLRTEPGFLVWGRGKRSRTAELESGSRDLIESLAPADDALVAARAGILSAQPGFRDGPVFVRPPMSSYGAALLAIQAIAAALFDRERTGIGCSFSVPLLNGALAMQASHLLDIEHGDAFPPARRTPYDGRPLYRLYQCQDGRWLHFGVLTPRFWPGVAIATGHPEWISDPRYQTMPNLPTAEEREAFSEMLAAELDQKPCAEWERLFEAQDVPVAPAQTVDEFLEEPQLRAAGMIVELEDPRVGPMRQSGLSIGFERTPGEIRGPAPEPDDGSGPPWWPAGSDSLPDRAPRRPGIAAGAAPLAGVRIIDFSNFIAGPLGPAFLADLGAEVIKVEAPEGDGLRNARGFIAWNRGKRNIALDMKRPQAREVLYRLVQRADVFVENMRPGVAERLGVDYETLRALNPRLIYCSVTAYGASGPYRNKPGFDPLMQARSGIERAQGGFQNPPNFLLVPITDNTCAMLNAAGIALALYERERSGEGQRLETSLLRAACLLQSDGLVAYHGKPERPANDPGQFGPSVAYRLYRCSDGWIFLAAGAAAHGQLARWAGLDDYAASGGDRAVQIRLAERLGRRFATQTVDGCCHELRAQGLPATPVTDDYQRGFAADPRLLAQNLIISYDHPLYGVVRQPARLAPLGDTPACTTRHAPLLGEQTREILAEAGYDAGEIADLIRRGIAQEPDRVTMKGE